MTEKSFTPSAGGRTWRTVDVVVAAVLGAALGVVFYAWGLLWGALGPLFTAIPPAQGFMYGVWLMPGVLGALVVRKPGASVFCALVASVVSALLGSAWGLNVVWYGLLQGGAAELVFAATRYRTFQRPVALLAGAASGLVAVVLDRIYYYPAWSWGWVLLYAVLVVPSAALVGGYASWLLVRSLATTGVLDQFAAGRERTRI